MLRLSSTLDAGTLDLMAAQRRLLSQEVVDEAALGPIVEELRARRGRWGETAMERLVLSTVSKLEGTVGPSLRTQADVRVLQARILSLALEAAP